MTTILDLCDQTSQQIFEDSWYPIGVQSGRDSFGWLLCCGGTSDELSYTAAIVSIWKFLFCDLGFAVAGVVN